VSEQLAFFIGLTVVMVIAVAAVWVFAKPSK